MYCGKCGAEVNDKAAFCPKCGNKLRVTHEISKQPSPPKPPTPFPYKILIVCVAFIIAAVVTGIWFGKGNDNKSNQSSVTNATSQKEDSISTEEPSSSDKVYDTKESIKSLFGDVSVSMEYPNFEELSVGMTDEIDGIRYHFLFDKNGKITFWTNTKEAYIESGFYDGMCMVKSLSGTYMIDSEGNGFKPSFLNKADEIIYYGKDTTGTTLWSVRKEDSIEGSNTILTAWSSSGEIKFQCDSNTSDLLGKFGATNMYEKLINYRDDNYALRYCGGAEYSFGHSYISRSLYCGVNIRGKSVHELEGDVWFENEHGLLLSSSGNMRYVSLMDEKGNAHPGWESLMYRLQGPLSEGLFFLDGREYPAGFYDINLNQKIDLSRYRLLPVANDGPLFVNGYAVLQLENDDHIEFWGVIDKNGNWTVEPQKGKLINIIPSASNLIIRVEDVDTEDLFYVYDACGVDLSSQWEGYRPSMYNGYALMAEGYKDKAPSETYNGEVYMTAYISPEYQYRIINVNKDGAIKIIE